MLKLASFERQRTAIATVVTAMISTKNVDQESASMSFKNESFKVKLLLGSCTVLFFWKVEKLSTLNIFTHQISAMKNDSFYKFSQIH